MNVAEMRRVAAAEGLQFGLKLSNTLEVENLRQVFDPAEETMYLSGRPLHAITVNLASKLDNEFDGDLLMSFSAGANCFNGPDLLAAGMQTVTSCSDLLKTGGYRRLLQYLECLDGREQAFGLVVEPGVGFVRANVQGQAPRGRMLKVTWRSSTFRRGVVMRLPPGNGDSGRGEVFPRGGY